ncbi:aminotransferase DegT, partial [Enterococcus faecium]|uniref:DegT/DnrJ/EryC1/StrS family aminotransferase n=1 Tax=Enterococcus faecium TaxID=1352 RepID=UPI000C028D2B
SKLSNIQFMPENKWNEPNYWLSVIIIKGINTNHLIDELDKNNIEARPVWKPMHLQPVFKNYDYIGDDVAETLFDLGVCLPSDTKMTDEDLKYVVSTIKRVINDA